MRMFDALNQIEIEIIDMVTISQLFDTIIGDCVCKGEIDTGKTLDMLCYLNDRQTEQVERLRQGYKNAIAAMKDAKKGGAA